MDVVAKIVAHAVKLTMSSFVCILSFQFTFKKKYHFNKI